jgi:LysR family nod box-dependent transcriptional activator
MRFNKLDLNLLVALDALLKERSVSRAAERLNLSPSALSNSLARLREYFDDELLVQIGRKMEITPRAADLQPLVSDVLIRIDSAIITPPAFKPDKSDRVFRIFASDYTQLVLVPHMLSIANEQRCSASFEFMRQISDPHRQLELGEADVLVIPETFMSTEHPHEVLYEEPFVCVVWRDSPLAQGELSFARYMAARHAVMRPSGNRTDAFEDWFQTHIDQPRQIAVSTYSFAALPAMVVGTPFIATMHERLARRWASSWPLEIRPVPVPAVSIRQSAQWHRYRGQDTGLIWLRSVLREAARRMDAPAP